jgi:hypothetical protein
MSPAQTCDGRESGEQAESRSNIVVGVALKQKGQPRERVGLFACGSKAYILFERNEGWCGLMYVGFFMGFGLARTEWCGPLFFVVNDSC